MQLQAMVERYLEVDLEAVNPMGDPVRMRCSGWQARILQHEVDHLQVSPCFPSSQMPPTQPPPTTSTAAQEHKQRARRR